MQLDLVEADNAVLSTPCQRFNFTTKPVDPIELAQALVKKMYDLGGVGLAANQVGVPYRVFAMRGAPQNFVCYNPRIVQPSEQMIVLEEGCLTYPNLIVKIKRPEFVRVRFQLPNSEMRTETFVGLTARIFQHEIDHLDGKVFFQGVSRYQLQKAIREAKEHGSDYDGKGLLRYCSD